MIAENLQQFMVGYIVLTNILRDTDGIDCNNTMFDCYKQ